MKRIVDEAKRNNHSPEIIRVELKEYLQYFILDFLYNSKFKDLIFYGGSCLRILYELPRMSEDLDFEAEEEKIDFPVLSKELEKYFQSDLLMKKIKIAPNEKKNLIRIFLIFPVAQELGLSTHKDETLKIKIEIRLVSHAYMKLVKWIFTPLSQYGKVFVVKHYDLSTLMATKLAAILERPEKGFHKGHPDEGIAFKGRDFYDLLWYMEKSILPNENMLRVNGITKTMEEVFDRISIQISKMDIKGIQKDIENLFIQPNYAENWIRTFRETFSRLKEKRYSAINNLKLDEILVSQDFDRNRLIFNFQFISETKRRIVSFLFYISDYFIRFKKGEGLVHSKLSEENKKKLLFWKDLSKPDKDQFSSYAAIFLKKIQDYLERHHGQVYFEKWESKFIRMTDENYNPREEIIFLQGQDLESQALRLEDLQR